MPKKRTLILIAVIIIIMIAVPILAVLQRKKAAADSLQTQSLTLWQIDGFEGGRGSRGQYLQNIGNRCFKDEKIYLTVTSLSSDAARLNIEKGNLPDIVSYPAGFYGIEHLINKEDFAYKCWCRGGYCFLTLSENATFDDISKENTVVNAGKDNLASVTAVLCGLDSAAAEEPTNAYLKLIGCKYKYLLGTQRDIFRLKTRGVSFSVKPVTQFNDLYQNISIITKNSQKYKLCARYVNYLLEKGQVGSLGLFNGKDKNIDEDLRPLCDVKFEKVLNCLCSKTYIDELKSAAVSCDVNKIKNILK